MPGIGVCWKPSPLSCESKETDKNGDWNISQLFCTQNTGGICITVTRTYALITKHTSVELSVKKEYFRCV